MSRRRRPLGHGTNVQLLTVSPGRSFRRVTVSRSWVAALVCAGCLVLGVEAPDAQERLRLSGWVQWIAGSRLQMMTDGGTVVISVDLREADQSSYLGLRPGERIVVDGVVAGDRTRVIARDIWRNDGGGFQSP
jgi:hypothetical protein